MRPSPHSYLTHTLSHTHKHTLTHIHTHSHSQTHTPHQRPPQAEYEGPLPSPPPPGRALARAMKADLLRADRQTGTAPLKLLSEAGAELKRPQVVDLLVRR